MATITFKQLIAPQQLTNAASTYYTSPSNTKTRVDKLTFSNPTSAVHTVTVWISGSTDAKNVVKTRAIAPNDTLELTEIEGQVLEAGDTIQMQADANTAITVVASGITIV